MTIKPILAAAGLSLALFAAPAFAQSSATKAEDYAKEKAVEEVKEKATDMAKEKAEDMVMDEAKKMKGDHKLMIKSSDGDMAVGADGVEPLVDTPAMEPEMAKEDMMMAPAPTTTVVVSCPEGTTAQDDGTCMITGDYAE